MSANGWPMVPLGEVITKSDDRVPVEADRQYPNFGIYSFGRGVFAKPPIDGTSSSATTLYKAKAHQFVYSRLFAFEGAYGVVPPAFDGYFVSNEFPLFRSDESKVIADYLGWFFRNPAVWPDIARLTTGMGNRRQRIKPEALLGYKVPLPSLEDQQRIVARIDRLAAKVREAQGLAEQCDNVSDSLLMAQFHRITENVPRRPLGEIAPLIRRPAEIDPTAEYPQVSVRSFGKGTFHNPPLHGSEITWQKPHLVEVGDILVSNIKAWEGAIAVAAADDGGRYGSHRYLTFVPVAGVATAHFVCFYLLSPEGLYHVGEASPGSADQNRTLSSKKMLNIEIPLPPFELQQRFDELLSRVSAARNARAQAANARDALLPSILDRAFRGEL